MIKQKFHIVGVGGVGMSAVAELLRGIGQEVTGSDRDFDNNLELEVFDQLKATGVTIVPQDGRGIKQETSSIIVSTAIEETNPDIQTAKKLNINIKHRAEMLAELANPHRLIAITGTAGKSTVTGMIGWCLEQLGADPTVINGAPILGWRGDKRVGNVRIGQSDIWIIEADESDGSLLHFKPDIALVTNLSNDHLGQEATRKIFDQFHTQTKTDFIDLSRSREVFDKSNIVLTAQGSKFTYGDLEYEIPLPGRHNAENALCALIVCEKLGYVGRAVRDVLKKFPGIYRRLQVVDIVNGIRVVDDYAHNAAKIEASCLAVRPEDGKIFAIWQPHGFKALAKAFADLPRVFGNIWRPGDKIIILPVFYVGGTTTAIVTSEDVVQKLQELGLDAKLAQNQEEATNICQEAERGDTIIVMGARDQRLSLLPKKIAEKLRTRKNYD